MALEPRAVAEQLAHVLLGPPQHRRLKALGGRGLELRSIALEHLPELALGRPARDRDPPARPADALDLARGGLVVGREHVPEDRDDAVEASRPRTAGPGRRPTIQSTSTMASAPCSRATSIRPGDKSSPVTRAASLAAGIVALPVPQADVEHVHARADARRLRRAARRLRRSSPRRRGNCRCPTCRRSWRSYPLPQRRRLTCKSAGHGFDRHRHRRPPPLRRGRRRRRRARRGERRVRARPLQRDHGALGLRQVDADAHPRRARPPDLGLGSARRRRDLGPRRRRPDQAAPRQARLHLPVLQPDPGAHRRGEHRAAALDRRPQGRRRLAATGWSRRSG